MCGVVRFDIPAAMLPEIFAGVVLERDHPGSAVWFPPAASDPTAACGKSCRWRACNSAPWQRAYLEVLEQLVTE